MNLHEIHFRDISTSSLSVGSSFSYDEFMFYTEGSGSLNFPFGKLDKDGIRFSVYNLDNTPATSSMVYVGGTYTDHTQSYYDVYNRNITYSYQSFKSDWVLTGTPTQSLFFDVSKEMNALNLSDGNYIVTVELLRNMVGAASASNDKLLINAISSNRTEISLIPKCLANTTSSLMDDFTNFSLGQFKVKEVAQDLLDAIGSPQIYNSYFTASAANQSGAESFKFNYGFNSRVVQKTIGSTNYNTRGVSYNGDIDVVAFLTDMYYGVRKGNLRANGQVAINDITGIYDQFKNWLFLNYEAGATFADIKNYYYSLFRFVADLELNHLSNKKPADYDNIVAFLQSIYYDIIFAPKEAVVESAYNTNLSGYFKNYVNLDDETSIAILNRKYGQSTDSNFNSQLILKLAEPLPAATIVGDELWITNTFGFVPIVQNLYYFTRPNFQTIRLRGPNLLIRIENEGNSTEALTMGELIEQTGSLYNELISKIGARTSGTLDTTNYREFKNFINFSSATLRMAAFDYKQSQVDALQSNIVELSGKLALNPSDKFYRMELDQANSDLDQLEASMDGYEAFLYNNRQWYAVQAESASLYDRGNGNSLINNLPQFIVEDSANNSDYITFVGMIGHFFDNLSIAVKQITEKNNYSSSPNYGVSLDIVNDMLRSLGWDAEISKDNLPLLLSAFSKQDFDENSELYNLARSFSEEERNQVIWKRILNTLPYLYKTKGTEAGLNALITCFGIPKNIVKVREYGGIHKAHNLQDSTLCIIDEVKYEPYFSGSGEYFQINWTGSAQTVEFNFAFDPSSTSAEGKVFRLVDCSGSWVMGAYRERGLDWGRLFFSLGDGLGNVQTMMTNKAPIFDGNTYHTMLRRNNPAVGLNLTSASQQDVDPFPIKYDLYVQKATDARITFFATSSFHFSGSYNENFRSGSYLFVGNYQQNTASLNIDPEAFFGNIDEIKVWEAAVSDERFTNHTLHQNSYDLETPQQMIAENLVRISFERPIDLYDSASLPLNNLSFRDDFPTFDAVNFPAYYGTIEQTTECGVSSASIFPYQFTRKDSRQTMKLPDYGASKFRSNKINYVEQELLSNLSSTQRSSMQASELVSVDANRLGVFFSPAETQNAEIIKFFGDYPLMDLIGDPSSVYESSYRKFEKFKQVFYDQGFGAVDYQFFMNIVRFYFDKAMLKYIRALVPARAKLVDGILVEPSILERPKIQLKPIVQKVIDQRIGVVDGKTSTTFTTFPRLTASLAQLNSGTSILRDVNQVMFPTDEDKHGFGIYSDNFGITYYKGDYYRSDVIKIKKSYQMYNKYNLPTSSLNDYERYIDLNGTVQTISSSYYKTSLAKLPIATSYPITMSFSGLNGISFYLSGSLGFGLVDTQSSGLVPILTYTCSVSHTISGLVTGSFTSWDTRKDGPPFGRGTISAAGLRMDGTASIAAVPSGVLVTGSFLYSGSFTIGGNGEQLFEGNVSYYPPTTASAPNPSYFAPIHASIIPTDYTSSIFDQFNNNVVKTGNNLFTPSLSGVLYRKELSMVGYPRNATLFTGYSSLHYKYSRQEFSNKNINSYDQNSNAFKWKRGSQNKKTTVDPTSGLLDNTDPVQTKTS